MKRFKVTLEIEVRFPEDLEQAARNVSSDACYFTEARRASSLTPDSFALLWWLCAVVQNANQEYGTTATIVDSTATEETLR